MSDPTPTTAAPASTDAPVFDLNGTKVPLAPQDRGVYGWLAGQVYMNLRKPDPVPPLQGLLAMMALDAGRQGVANDDPRVQAVLNVLWQMGIAKVRTEGEGAEARVSWDAGTHASIGSRPVIEHFTEDGVREGRALAAALMIATTRQVRINGVELAIRPVNLELLQAQGAELQKRLQPGKEDASLTAARYVAELLAQGATDKDLRLRAALELAADLGVRSMLVDAPSRQLRIEGFNEQAAVAAAYLQGMAGEQFDMALKRIQTLNQVAQETARRLAEQAKTGNTKAAAIAPRAQPQAAPAAVATPVKRRRRD